MFAVSLFCSRPTALHDRARDSDDDDLHDRDYDVAALANNLSQAFRYKLYGNGDAEEVHSCLTSIIYLQRGYYFCCDFLRSHSNQFLIRTGSVLEQSEWFC